MIITSCSILNKIGKKKNKSVKYIYIILFRKQIEGKKGKETETRKRKFKVDHIKERKDKHQESKRKKKKLY